jgi:hypothetical protein
MSDSMELQDISNVVESNLCRFDIEYENEFTNKRALQLLELAFDKYHFKDSELAINNSELKIQFERMLQIIEQDLIDTSKEQLVKVMASIYDEFVKSRHSGENRSPDGPQLLENTGFRLSPE